MAIDQKRRSLHCNFDAGLKFEEINGEEVIFLHHVPYELEDIVIRWIAALPEYVERTPTGFLREHPSKGVGLTRSGWSAFVNWMVEALREAQKSATFNLQFSHFREL